MNELPAGELLVFSQLVLFAFIARVALTIVGLPRISTFITWGANHRFLCSLPFLQNRYEISCLARLADLAARGTRADGPCLLRSILLLWLLKARGGQAELLIGVNKENGKLNGHAWDRGKGNDSR